MQKNPPILESRYCLTICLTRMLKLQANLLSNRCTSLQPSTPSKIYPHRPPLLSSRRLPPLGTSWTRFQRGFTKMTMINSTCTLSQSNLQIKTMMMMIMLEAMSNISATRSLSHLIPGCRDRASSSSNSSNHRIILAANCLSG